MISLKKEKEEQYCKGGYTAPEQYLEKEFVGQEAYVFLSLFCL